MKEYLTTEQVKELFIFVGQQVMDAKPLLTEVDSAIGDGDHGVGMEIGFKQAIENLQRGKFENVNNIFVEIGKSMVGSMGGASGILFGTFFIASVKNKPIIERLQLEEFAIFVQSGLEGVKLRGKANVGDKTMVDALVPASNSLIESVEKEEDFVTALQQASHKAHAGKEQTKQLIAKFGRAKSLGDRTIGHQDAGATTIAIMFEAIFAYVNNLKNEGNLLYE